LDTVSNPTSISPIPFYLPPSKLEEIYRMGPTPPRDPPAARICGSKADSRVASRVCRRLGRGRITWLGRICTAAELGWSMPFSPFLRWAAAYGVQITSPHYPSTSSISSGKADAAGTWRACWHDGIHENCKSCCDCCRHRCGGGALPGACERRGGREEEGGKHFCYLTLATVLQRRMGYGPLYTCHREYSLFPPSV
jgi:hypothetical protein